MAPLPAKDSSERIIMGIDPGTNITGYGMIRTEGAKMSLLHYGIIDLRKLEDDHPAKLKRIFERVLGLVEEFLPDELAIEAPFFGKNVQSMLKLGRAQGVAMAAALSRDIPIIEYAPRKVKMAITGNGNASKEMVGLMLEQILKFKFDDTMTLDASDGIAVAVCHFMQRSSPATGKGKGKKAGSWESFVKNNPKRII